MKKSGRGRHAENSRTENACAAKRFGRYELEEERLVKPAEVKSSATVQRMAKIFKKVSKAHAELERMVGVLKCREPFAFYAMFVLEAKKFSYSGADIQSFLFSFKCEEDGYSGDDTRFNLLGLFLSALMNAGKEESYALKLEHIGRMMPFLGYHNNGKSIDIFGDVGFSLGEGNNGGRIIVHGNCCSCEIGKEMFGGEIIIEGSISPDGRCSIGDGMGFGRITVKGDLGESTRIGPLLVNGEVDIRGNGDITINKGSCFAGKVFQKGRIAYREGC